MMRLSPVDIASLDNVECRAILVRLAGHPDPAVAGAVVDAARKMLDWTRCEMPPGMDHLAATPGATPAEAAILQALWLGMRGCR